MLLVFAVQVLLNQPIFIEWGKKQSLTELNSSRSFLRFRLCPLS